MSSFKNEVEQAKKDVQLRIDWEQEFIDKKADVIRNMAATLDAERIAYQLPSEIMQLKESIDRRTNYAAQLQMLNYICKKATSGE